MGSLGMFSRSWIINGRGLSRKVKNVSEPSSCQIKDSGETLECPYCYQTIDNSDLSEDWSGLPVGVKFDPSDSDLLEHLATKCGVGNLKPHWFIDEFIPTLEGHEGICYTHPENLPGAKKNGSSIHFFYRTFNAYATGHRKRRKIQDDGGLIKGSVCWHKTGKTKSLLEMDFFQWNGQDEYTLLAGESQAIEEDGNSNTLFYNIAHDDISLDAQIKDEHGYTTLPGESQDAVDNGIRDFLMCNEMIHPWMASSPGLRFEFPTDTVLSTNPMKHGDCKASCSLAELVNLDLHTPPDPADLPIMSHDNILDWWDKL